MKRFFWTLFLAICSTSAVLSQEIRMKENPDEYFYLANQLYREGEFPGCYRALSTWFERAENDFLLEDASFLRATVAYELDKRDASILLIRFVKDFPLSINLPKAYYLLGCTALNAQQYPDAIHFFKQCPESVLQLKELDEYRFRVAYSSLQIKDYDTARKLFAQIAEGANRYIPSATYFLAYMDYAEGKIQAAREGFNKVSDQEQYRNVTDYFKLQLLYIDGKLDETIQTAEEMLGKKPTVEQKTELVRLLAAAWFDKKRYALSQQYYQEYLAMAPEIGRSDLYRIGINYYSQRNYPSAINYLTQASGKEDAISQSATYHIGLCYLKQSKKDQARMSFEQTSMKSFDKKTQEKALFNYALVCYEATYSPFNEQAKAFQKLIAEYPNSEYTQAAYTYLSDVFLASKDYAGSIAFIDSMNGTDPGMLQTKCTLLFRYGVEKYNAQKFAEAQQLLTKAALLAMENQLPLNDILYWKGECNYRLGFMKEAAEDFQNYASDPANQKSKALSLVSYQLGYAYFEQGLYDDAKIWFDKYIQQAAVKKEKTYTDALNRLGDCWFQAKDISKAEKSYQLAQSSVNTGSDYATYQLAICQGARKSPKEKITLLNTLEKKYPKSVYLDRTYFEMGKTYQQLKQPEEAMAAFDKLLSKYPNAPLSRKAYLLQAGLLQENEKTDQAVASYKKVIELYPGSQEAQDALNGLKTIFVKNNTVSHYLDYTAGLRGIVKIETGGEDTLAYQAAETSLKSEKTTAAIEAYTFYLNRFPTGAFRDECSFKLGRLLMAAGRIQEGLNALDSLSMKSGNSYQVPAVMLLAEGYVSSNNYAMALNEYQKLEGLASDRVTSQTALMGVIRASYELELYKNAVDAANRMLNDENPGTDLQRETLYYRAMSLMKDEKVEQAIKDFKVLGAETYAALGAEARFRLAECLYNEGNEPEAEVEVRQFLKEGSPHAYWLARASILLVDICINRGKDTEARQYLTSLKQNYKQDNDVQDMMEDRMKKLSQRSN